MGTKNTRKKSNVKKKYNKMAVSGMLAWLIFLIVRIPVTNMIGDEGNAYLSAAVELYLLAVCLLAYPIPEAMSKMITVRMSRGEIKNAGHVFNVVMLFFTVLGIAAGALVFLGADFLAGTVMAEPMSASALRILSPALPLIIIANALSGYFQGLGTVMPTNFSKVLEQIIFAVSCIFAVNLFSRYGVKVGAFLHNDTFMPAYGTVGAAFSVLTGAVAAVLFLFFVFSIYRLQIKNQMEKDTSKGGEASGILLRSFLLSFLPLLLIFGIYQARHVIDQAVYAHMLSTSKTVRLNFGIYYGKYRVLTEIPMALAGISAVTVAPLLASMLGKADVRVIKERVAVSFKTSIVVALPFAAGLAFLAEPVVRVLYKGDFELASRMLRNGTLCIVLFVWAAVSSGILHGIRKDSALLLNMTASLVLHVVSLIVMIQYLKLDIFAVIYSNIIMALVLCLMNQIVATKALNYRQEWIRTLVLPGAVSLLMGGIQLGIVKLFEKAMGIVPVTLAAVVIGGILYFVLVIRLKVLNERELSQMPAGKELVKIAKAIRILT